MRAGLFGVGEALPEQVLTNAHWAERLDTTEDWIVKRTGIRERRWLDGGDSLAELATLACERALADAGRRPADVDRVIVSTATPDHLTPGLALERARLTPADLDLFVAHQADARIVEAAAGELGVAPEQVVIDAAGFVWGAGVVSWKERAAVYA